MSIENKLMTISWTILYEATYICLMEIHIL